MGGEYTVVHWARCMASELPPHARRIHAHAFGGDRLPGDGGRYLQHLNKLQ